jgi:hypothetical protein
MTDERENKNKGWVTVEHPGQFGKNRAEMENKWNDMYGEGNWRIIMETAQGKRLDFDDIMCVFIEGYTAYFIEHSEEARLVTDNYSYTYDKDEITRAEAFDPWHLYEKPGITNQFHHVAMNMALEGVLGIAFRGDKPLKVRLGKPSVPVEEWPSGWKWSPTFIPCVHPEEISDVTFSDQWWKNGSIEDFYQKSKALQVRKS